jgi:hypothetical protein
MKNSTQLSPVKSLKEATIATYKLFIYWQLYIFIYTRHTRLCFISQFYACCWILVRIVLRIELVKLFVPIVFVFQICTVVNK